MATKRIKDLTNTAASVASDAYLAIDGTSNGTEKITRDNFRQDTADAFVAAPGTYNLAPLSGGAVEVAKGGTGATTAAGARTNLSVNSKDEDAEATATKLVGPALYFDGSNDYVEVASDSKFGFTDGTSDLPLSIECWLRLSELKNSAIIARHPNSTTAEWELKVEISGKITFRLFTTGGTSNRINVGSLTALEVEKWYHICGTYDGSGNASGLKIAINGVDDSDTPYESGTYTGMSETSQAVWIGRSSSSGFFHGHIKDVKLYNRSLTASEVAQLARGNDLGFADEWGGALGGAYSSDFSAGVDGWTASLATAAGNIDAIGGVDDTLRITVTDTTSNLHYTAKSSVFTVGKRFRLSFDYYIPSSNSNVDGFRAGDGISTARFGIENTPTLDTWNTFSGEGVPSGLNLVIFLQDGGATTFQDSGGDDVIYFKNVTITEIGTLADFRAEDYNESASKLLDRSSNNFVGVGTSVTLTGNQRHISADTIDLKNLPTSSAGLSAGEVWSNGGVLTVV